MSREMPLTIEFVTPTRTLVKDVADVVSVPTPQGEISILPSHTPLMSVVAHGELRIQRDGDIRSYAVSGGILVVLEHSDVLVLADVAERAEDVSEAQAEEAYRRAAALRWEVSADDTAFAAATAALDRELARLRVARRVRHRGHHGPARGTLEELRAG